MVLSLVDSFIYARSGAGFSLAYLRCVSLYWVAKYNTAKVETAQMAVDPRATCLHVNGVRVLKTFIFPPACKKA